MSLSLNLKFEQGVRFLVQYFPPSDESSRKPVLFHDIRVGVCLYQHGYSDDIVLAGLLYDALEWSSATTDVLRKEFGENILKLVRANTKDDTIEDKDKKTNELIQRCAQTGQDALIIKAADILDSFQWYANQKNIEQLGYCMRNADALFRFKKNDFNDPIFDELARWKENV